MPVSARLWHRLSRREEWGSADLSKKIAASWDGEKVEVKLQETQMATAGRGVAEHPVHYHHQEGTEVEGMG